jgi:hypothetical protein
MFRKDGNFRILQQNDSEFGVIERIVEAQELSNTRLVI